MHRLTNAQYFQRVLITVGVVIAVFGLVWLLWTIANMLLLVFLGILMAIALRTSAKPLARYTPLSHKGAVIVVLLTALVALGLGGFFFIPEVLNQTDQLVDTLAVAWDQMDAFISQTLGDSPLERIWGDQQSLPGPNLIARLTGTFANTLGILANVLFIVFTGVFLAIEPRLYRKGVITLIPPNGRQRAQEVISQIVDGLQAWLLGQLIAMVTIGTVVAIGLMLLNVPLAIPLGVVSGLLEFIPIVGSLLSAVPAVLIAFTQGIPKALYVALFFFVAQQIEGNILTPIVQQKTVSLPPALTLSAVLIMGFLFGPMGVLVATPMAAVVYILVKLLYVEDLLGTRSDRPSKPHKAPVIR
ncbi:AI-2E family transporter [Leptolyngbya sp. AN02str]|uniref:AI-2E family transporter n=1 Tax=Leptolyngbya sp. AN02str TaxID=3423363 RepID=UPI003D318543